MTAAMNTTLEKIKILLLGTVQTGSIKWVLVLLHHHIHLKFVAFIFSLLFLPALIGSQEALFILIPQKRIQRLKKTVMMD